jgi:hypothetical protein
MGKGGQSKQKSYRRDDGVLMIEVRPGQFVNERGASLLNGEPGARMRSLFEERISSRGGRRHLQTHEDAR